MDFDSETTKIAREQLIDIYAEYKALMSIPSDKRDKKRILEIAAEIRELTTKYSITLASVETAATTKSQEIAKKNKDEFEAKKKAEEQKKKEEAEAAKAETKKKAEEAAERKKKEDDKIRELAQIYYKMKDAELAASGKSFKKLLTGQHRGIFEFMGDFMNGDEETALNERKAQLKKFFEISKKEFEDAKEKFLKEFPKSSAEMAALEKAFEKRYETTYRIVGEADKRLSDASYTVSRRKNSKVHKIAVYKKMQGKASRAITTTLSAAALVAGVIYTSGFSLPVLPILGVTALVASAGQRKLLTSSDRNEKLCVYYSKILKKQEGKLKIITDKQKNVSENSKQFVSLKRSEARQKDKMTRTKHKIAHVTKYHPIRKDVIAAGIQIGASFLLATSFGALAPQIAIGVALFGIEWLAKAFHKDKKK